MGPTWDKRVVDWPRASRTTQPQWGPCMRPMRRGVGHQNPNPRACLGGKPPPLPPALGGGVGRSPPAPYIRRDRGGGAAPQGTPHWCPSRTPLPHSRRPPPPPLSPTQLGEALSDLHHTHHATVVVLLISSLSTTSCGIKNVESSSSHTCGYLGGVARVTHRIIHLLATRQV